MQLLFFLSLAAISGGTVALRIASGTNGGSTCAGCTIVVGLAEQLAEYYNHSVDVAFERLCRFLPSGIFRIACEALVDEFAPLAIELIAQKETPDVVCLAIGLCSRETGETCHLFPLPDNGQVDAVAERVSRLKRAVGKRSGDRFPLASPPKICDLPGVAEVCAWIERFADRHEPLDDIDGDRFSTVDEFRGASWRGKDCNDFNAGFYPGLQTLGDRLEDTNCNGIYGLDRESGRTYEDLWCNGTQQYGTLLLGDSAGAHFHAPPAWLNVTLINEQVFQHLLFIAGNELDWPQFSAATGYHNISWLDVIDGPVDSFYLRLVELNRCNHRDYQNAGVNGARASSMASSIVESISRNQNKDHPVFITFELIGNDVCSGHHDIDHMTTPEEFRAENQKTFEYLDTRVPPGSKMIVYGVADGRLLYDSLHDRIHPIGALRGDVTYTHFYDYLNCLTISPCFGWMNHNETWRNRTTERAMELNQALKELIETISLKNIEVVFYEDVLSLVIEYWQSQGGQAWQLIEPADGFHPNQLANAIITKLIWEKLQKDRPGWIPPANPNNANIVNKFGNQGGY